MNNEIKSQIRHLIVDNKIERVELTALLNNLFGKSEPKPKKEKSKNVDKKDNTDNS